MNALSGVFEAGKASEAEALFAAEYGRVAALIARVIRDPGRAEELAVEVFLKYSRRAARVDDNAAGWLSRTAARMAVDELRAQERRRRYEPLLRLFGRAPTPEEIHCAQEEQARVRAVLGSLAVRQAELLLLRSEGLPYAELATTLGLHPASVGTLLRRAEECFRKEYVKRYGNA